MHIFWESSDWPGAKVEPGLTCLSWLPSSNGQGLLGSGSQSGSVGVTRTDIRPKAKPEPVPEKRVNFNLRGHHSAISIVAWNQPQSKLATCDEGGVIYVWVPYEERWSVELVNDRGVKVRDFAWSLNGHSALICYEDNFVLIGSATGQRIWSFTFQQNILCGTWSPDSTQVVIGSNNGNLHLLTDQGTTIAEYTINQDHPIEKVAWSSQRSSDLKSTLCACFRNGTIYFLECCDDGDPTIVHTDLTVIAMQWTCSGEYLAVIGHLTEADKTFSRLLVYNGAGTPVLATDIPGVTGAVTAFTWAHDDQCVVLAAGGEICVGRVTNEVPCLEMLSSNKIWSCLSDKLSGAQALPLPNREKSMVAIHNYHIVQCQIPNPQEICEAVCRPSDWRWYCTIRPVPRRTQMYTLCMEHLSGLVPILSAKQINKFLPEFEIRSYRPGDRQGSRSRSGTPEVVAEGAVGGSDEIGIADLAEPGSARKAENAASPFQKGNFQRDSMWRRSKRQLQAMVQRKSPEIQLRKEDKLVQVSSNVWCTRFKLVGMAPHLLPPYLGQVVYKTSVLHLQPRQMSVEVVDLENHSLNSNPVPPPPAEADADGVDENLMRPQRDEGPPIAPMDSEIFVRRDVAEESRADDDDPLLAEEQALLNQVLLEFGELRAAVDRHIQRMRDFAVDLQQSSQQLNTRRGLPVGAQRRQDIAEETKAKKNALNPICASPEDFGEEEKKTEEKKPTFPPKILLLEVEESSGEGGSRDFEEEKPETSRSTWEDQLNDLEFIDEDEELVVTSDKEKERLRARSLSYECPPVTEKEGSAFMGQIASSAVQHSHTVTPRRNGKVSATLAGRRPAPPRRTHSEYAADIEAVAEAVSTASAAFRRPSSARGSSKQLKEITSVLDKLYKLANELTTRPGVSDGGAAAGSQAAAAALIPPHPQIGGKVSPHRNLAPAMVMDTEPGPYNQLRERIRDIAQRVSQLERRINYGNELLDDVRSDLQRRVSHIRNVLGDPVDDSKESAMGVAGGNKKKLGGMRGSGDLKGEAGHKDAPEGRTAKVLTLQNKAPFWNEQSQVYQLDFGGRVTQESAKNFQIEHDDHQVMQFGRIDNGAYTLDFQGPFTAVQAFAVALASITQRLK